MEKFTVKWSLKKFCNNVISEGKYPIVGLSADNNTCNDVYFLRGCLKNEFITAFVNKKQLKKDGFIVITCNDLDIVH